MRGDPGLLEPRVTSLPQAAGISQDPKGPCSPSRPPCPRWGHGGLSVTVIFRGLGRGVVGGGWRVVVVVVVVVVIGYYSCSRKHPLSHCLFACGASPRPGARAVEPTSSRNPCRHVPSNDYACPRNHYSPSCLLRHPFLIVHQLTLEDGCPGPLGRPRTS